MRPRHLASALPLLVVLSATLAGQVTLTVPSSSHPTIQSAINAATAGDVVDVLPGVYAENLDFLGKRIVVRGRGRQQSIIDGGGAGPVVTFSGGEDRGSRLQGFMLRNGRGARTPLPPSASPLQAGGGLLVVATSPVTAAPTIVDCEIRSSQADIGGGVACIGGADVLVVDSEIAVNAAARRGGGVFVGPGARCELRRCAVRGNDAASGGGLAAELGEVLLVETTLAQNSASGLAPAGLGGALYITQPSPGFPVTPFEVMLDRCVLRDNSALQAGGAVHTSGGGLSIGLGGCLIVRNFARNGSVLHEFVARPNVHVTVFHHCTVFGNVASDPLASTLQTSGTGVSIINTIVWGNTRATEYPGAPPSIEFSIVEGDTRPGAFPPDPRLVDPANGDFHLRLDSPAIEGGGRSGNPPESVPLQLTDIDGDPRVKYGHPDMGVDEVVDVGLSLPMRGTAGSTDLLLVNGGSGGAGHHVTLASAESVVLTVAQPTSSFAPARFAVFGFIGVPAEEDAVGFPVLGTMAFPPCPLSPGDPRLFTVTSNIGNDPCGAVLPSTPTPWSSPALPGVSVPFSLTLQGVIEVIPGVFRLTNGVILDF